MMIFGFYDGDGAQKNINTNSKNIDMAFVRRESFLYRLPSGDSVDGQQNEPQWVLNVQDDFRLFCHHHTPEKCYKNDDRANCISRLISIFPGRRKDRSSLLLPRSLQVLKK